MGLMMVSLENSNETAEQDLAILRINDFLYGVAEMVESFVMGGYLLKV